MIDDDRYWVISGGIGSGKSAVRKLLEHRSMTTIDADSIGHEVLQSDGPAFAEVAAKWPEVLADDVIDRGALGRIVFADQNELETLERITHPYIFDRIRRRVQGISGVVFVEIPLLEFDLGPSWRRLVVDCADDVRLERLLAKGMDASDADSRMSSQPSRGTWLARADLVIPNHGSLRELEATVEEMLDALGD